MKTSRLCDYAVTTHISFIAARALTLNRKIKSGLHVRRPQNASQARFIKAGAMHD